MGQESTILIAAADSGFKTKRITLYKYITPKALEELIKHGDFKLTYRSDANDPFECLPINAHFSDDILSHIGIISLTSNPRNHPMWGNYADKFRGACVEFSFDYFYTDPNRTPTNKGEELALEGIEYKKMGTNVYFLQYRKDGDTEGIDTRGGDVLIRCHYSSLRSDNNIMFINRMPRTLSEAEQLKQRIKEQDRILIQNAWRQVSTKHPDWKYEDEYRVTMRQDRCTRIIEPKKGEKIHLSNKLSRYITKIILGPFSQFTPEQALEEMNVHRAVSHLPKRIRVVKAVFPKDSFDLIIP